MRLFATSDVHIDYPDNARWVEQLSAFDYRDDVLVLAGDLTDRVSLMARCLEQFASKFRQVLFVPGNHDLWVRYEPEHVTSLDKFDLVCTIAADCGVSMRPYRWGDTVVIPLQGWYDYSFGPPDKDLPRIWMDYRACRWPEGYGPEEATAYFLDMNPVTPPEDAARVITFSHFLPRIDLIPFYVPRAMRSLDPVLGSTGLERQLRALGSDLHIYGHSHINRQVNLDGVTYINNAFGYPQEGMIAARRLIEVDLDAIGAESP